jgi:hypothetical protein
MRDSSVLAFRRMRRSERILDLHTKARDNERAGAALEAVDADSTTFEDTPPTSSKGVMIKAKEAIVALEASGQEAPANMLRHFFRTRHTLDGAWLRDLRFHVEAVKAMAPENDYAVSCLQSILAGISKPRLV